LENGPLKMGEERLQKILARAGFGSRRKCEEIVTAGRVKVNGEVVDELGAKADPAHDEITLDGELIYSKRATGRFPEPGEVEKEVAKRAA